MNEVSSTIKALDPNSIESDGMWDYRITVWREDTGESIIDYVSGPRSLAEQVERKQRAELAIM